MHSLKKKKKKKKEKEKNPLLVLLLVSAIEQSEKLFAGICKLDARKENQERIGIIVLGV